MPFTFTKISNYGTTHPVVARLLIQTAELAQWAGLSKDEKDSVFKVYQGLNNRLIKVHEAYQRLSTALDETMAISHVNDDGSLKSLPHLIGLDAEVETILYEIKNYLRDLLGVIRIFFRVEFENGSDFFSTKGNGISKIAKWATDAFGEEDPFTTMLISEHVWIEELIRKRNALEHPGGHSGTLHIHNFEKGENNKIVIPAWHRDEMPLTGIFPDLDVAMDNMLTLAEDVLVSCIVHNGKNKIIQFIEIPEDERNPECPIRIRVTLKDGIGPPPKMPEPASQ